MNKKNEGLATYFLVAVEIFKFEEKGERVWFSKLVEKGTLTRTEVAKSLDILEDWLLVRKRYGETIPGHAGMLYYLTSEGKDAVEKIKETKIRS